jgi:uncharacterized protein
MLIRNIVSDADKIDALGKIGIERCFQYSKATNSDLSDEDYIKNVIKHCDEKLLLLLPKYIKTEIGKMIAKPLHDEIQDWYNKKITDNL